MTAAVVVFVDHSPAGRTALRWAATESHRRGAPLHLLVDNAQQEAGYRSVVGETLDKIRTVIPDRRVTRRSAQGPALDALRELSADAGAVVVQASLPGVESVVAGAFCPVFVVPDHLSPREHGPVAVGVAPWTGEDVIDLAFEEAALRHARLIAVRTWMDSRLSLSTRQPDQLLTWDRTNDSARQELELVLSAWTVVHPDVAVEALVIEDRTAVFLLALTHRSQLLVLGRSARGALLAGIAGSPVSELLPRSRCPVLVVPAAGPSRTTLLPDSSHGWAVTGN